MIGLAKIHPMTKCLRAKNLMRVGYFYLVCNSSLIKAKKIFVLILVSHLPQAMTLYR